MRENVIGWSPYLLRAMNDHVCKQLIGTVIEYVSPRYGETYEQMVARIREEVARGDHHLPLPVADAISILRHEKIGRWESISWDWAEPPDYDPTAMRVAEGSRDRIKEDALYVRLGRDGRVASTPFHVTEPSSDEECERAGNYRYFVKSLLKEGGHSSYEYTKILVFIAALLRAIMRARLERRRGGLKTRHRSAWLPHSDATAELTQRRQRFAAGGTDYRRTRQAGLKPAAV